LTNLAHHVIFADTQKLEKDKMGRVLGLVGWPGAGKDLAAEYLQSSHNAVRWGHSDRIRELAVKRGVEIVDTSQLSALFEEQAAQEGYGWIAHNIAERVRDLRKRDKNRLVVITGVRFPEEVEVYKHFKGFKLVKIQADFNVRFRRTRDRQRLGERALTPSRFRAIEGLPGNAGIPVLMALPGTTIVNDGGVKTELYRSLDALVRMK